MNTTGVTPEEDPIGCIHCAGCQSLAFFCGRQERPSLEVDVWFGGRSGNGSWVLACSERLLLSLLVVWWCIPACGNVRCPGVQQQYLSVWYHWDCRSLFVAS